MIGHAINSIMALNIYSVSLESELVVIIADKILSAHLSCEAWTHLMHLWIAPHEVAGLFIDPGTCLSSCFVGSLLISEKLLYVVLHVRCHCDFGILLHDLFQGVILNLALDITVLIIIIVHADCCLHWRYEIFWWALLKWFSLIIVQCCVPQFFVIVMKFLRNLFGVDQSLAFLDAHYVLVAAHLPLDF